jgi:predicted dithiol-disulfide oxidoreductase (DUF899 family)
LFLFIQDQLRDSLEAPNLAQSQGADGLEAHHLVHAHGEFDKDFGVDEWHGTNAFIRNGDRVFRTYFINNRGDEQMGSTWNYLDITALGRQEEWRTRRRAILRPRRTSGGSGTMNTPTSQLRQWWSDRNEDDRDPADPRPRRSRSKGGKAK